MNNATSPGDTFFQVDDQLTIFFPDWMKVGLTRKNQDGQLEFFHLDKHKLKSILPHRGPMLLLDSIDIDTTGKFFLGNLKVREEMCENHVIGNVPILRGVDTQEIAAQLLGVFVYLAFPDLHGGACKLKKCSFEAGSYSIAVGDQISIKLAPTDVHRTTSKGKDLISVPGYLFVRNQDNKVVCKVKDIQLVVYRTNNVQSQD
ncbi:MAG: hypothetical protein US98_C0049G0009 [Parcubacteria group bacterium GW2011_GWC1_38_6]|nr:MAG: hypothetical protein US98_C0049G0009 [Parcubacteria group bacterium GW2011_GWC1_38_6]